MFQSQIQKKATTFADKIQLLKQRDISQLKACNDVSTKFKFKFENFDEKPTLMERTFDKSCLHAQI